jgi:hypothetical protein
MTLEEMMALPSDRQKELFEKLDNDRKKGKSTNYCVPLNTKVLTNEGWKFYHQLRVGEGLPTYSPETGFVEQDIILQTHFYENTPLVRIKNAYSSFVCTPNHRWFVSKRVNSSSGVKFRRGFVETKDLNTECNIQLYADYTSSGNSHVTSDEAFLMGLLLSDGYYRWSEKSDRTSSSFGKRKGVSCLISQSKNKFYKEVEDALDNLRIQYRKDTIEKLNGNTMYNYCLASEAARDFLERVVGSRAQKHEMNWTAWAMSLSSEAMKSFYQGFYLGDGDVAGAHRGISQNTGEIHKAIVACAQLVGGGRVSINKLAGSNCEFIRSQRTAQMTCQKVVKTEVPPDDTFCITTMNGTFIIWQDDFVGITGNSAMYGVGAPKLARELKVPVSEAKKLLEAYWKKNWAVKAYAENARIKKVNGQEWVYNPVSKFWYSLRSRKDVWSTTNQGTGVYCFDTWIKEFRKLRPQLTGQFHDEVILEVKEGSRDKAESLLRDAIDRTNEKLKLNVKLDISVQFGKSYADIH